MNRITQLLRERGSRKLLIPFLTVGYPDDKTSIDLARAAIESGADILELGMPFSDPLADGPQVQLSSQIALQNGVNLIAVLDAVATLRRLYSTPIVLMGYFNPVLTFGTSRFISQAKEIGVDGLIIPDLPVEESNGYLAAMKSRDLSSIYLVAPTSTRQRTKLIEKNCSDFVYAVTVTGVTGARQSFDQSTDAYLRRLKKELIKPFVAGFGVSSAESALRLATYADGVVIGSKLISLIQGARTTSGAVSAVGRFLADIRKSLNNL